MKVNREEFLLQLESVSPGLAKRETLEQSMCFVFKGGRIYSFNEEVACSHAVDLGFTGAVPADPLLNLLRKLSDEVLEITPSDRELIIAGKRRKAGIRLESEINLPVDSVTLPEQWQRLPEGFVEAVGLCQQCTGKDETRFCLTCVHLHPKWIEGSDDFQITRYKIKTGLQTSCLVRRDSIAHITNLNVLEVGESDVWIHFRNAAGLILSCRRYVEDYPTDLITQFLQTEGVKIALPKGLRDAADRAQVFSSQNTDSNQVLVQLRPGAVRIKGTGVAGWYQEVSKVGYQGPEMEFLISPAILMEITKSHSEFLVGETTLRVDAGRFQYASCLTIPDRTEVAELVEG